MITAFSAGIANCYGKNEYTSRMRSERTGKRNEQNTLLRNAQKTFCPAKRKFSTIVILRQ